MNFCEVNEIVPFQFPVFGPDNRGKIKGLSAADFNLTLWKNNVKQSSGVLSSVVGVITELAATGDYGANATMTNPGRWRLEIHYPAGDRFIEICFHVVAILPWNMPRGRTA